MYGFNIPNYIDYNYNYIAEIIKKNNFKFKRTKWLDRNEYNILFKNSIIRLPKDFELSECVINKDNTLDTKKTNINDLYFSDINHLYKKINSIKEILLNLDLTTKLHCHNYMNYIGLGDISSKPAEKYIKYKSSLSVNSVKRYVKRHLGLLLTNYKHLDYRCCNLLEKILGKYYLKYNKQ